MALVDIYIKVMVKSHGIKAIRECFVRPHHEVEAAKQPYYLGPLDLAMLSIEPTQKGLLFAFGCNNPTPPEIPSLVERLKGSLSLALVHFYPLAGRLETIKYNDEHACLIYVDCIKGPGARLIHASYADLAVSDILSSTDVHPAVRSFFDLGERMVNHDGHTKPLLSVQVTELLDGVFIGFTMSHTVLDGTSFIHFVSALSEILSSKDGGDNPNQISRVPLYKMFAPDGYGPIFKLPYLEPEEFVTRYDPGPIRDRIFHFSPESIARLKAKANEECRSGTEMVSSFMALSGLVWRSVTRARNPPGHEKTSCCLALNARPRLDPPLSDDYFGNLAGLVRGICHVEELLGQSLGWAASLLGQEVKRNTHEVVLGSVKPLADRPVVGQPGSGQREIFGAQHSLIIGGSPRFDMYGPEFGLGWAVAVRMGNANKDDGKVAANPGREGGGSVDLEICLRPHVMDALEVDEEFMSFVSEP